MKNYIIKGRDVIFGIEIQNTTTDQVSGTWSGGAYGAIIYPKASATNPMYKFEPLSVGIQLAGTGIVDNSANFTVVQNNTTGFVGVLATGRSWLVGSKIIMQGVFVQDPTSVDAVTNGIDNSYDDQGNADITRSKAAGISIT